jgi:tryptophanyl-tRNA synthetase
LKVNKPGILIGDRPTGGLPLGHWVGSLKNRVCLQEEYKYFLGGGSTLHFLSKRNTMDLQIYLV